MPEPREPGERIAAIDVGSNAMRLLFMQVLEEDPGPVFRKVSLMRMPLRLGMEAFGEHHLHEETLNRLVDSLRGFRLLMESWGARAYKACATASLRSLDNRQEVLERIEKEAGLRLEIVSGRREAELLLRNQPLDWHPESQHYLYVDVGGGSTELTLLRHGKVEASRSWPLGTVRLLAGAANSRLWQRMAHWLEDTCGSMRPLCVGSGGNINKLAALLRKDESETIAIWQVWEMLEKVQPMSLQQRMVRLGLRPDRADVFPHALRIYHHCMSAAGSTAILAPRMGLADALVREAWLDWKGKERRNGSATRRLARP